MTTSFTVGLDPANHRQKVGDGIWFADVVDAAGLIERRVGTIVGHDRISWSLMDPTGQSRHSLPLGQVAGFEAVSED